ncbi:MAG: polyprenyl diphosphate synthase [Pseudomonadales bacterium]
MNKAPAAESSTAERQLPATQAPITQPRHVAIIMDGNHRWAKQRHLPGAAGHRAGAKNVRPVAEACADAGVEILTLFAFSTENWQRPSREVNLLMDLMRNVLDNDIDELNQRGVRLRVIGDRERFAPDLQMRMNRVENLTRDNRRMMLNIAANFGGRWDIARAARQLAHDVAAGRVAPADVDEDLFGSYLSLGGLPAPDICIRTGGDARISNFLLWDFAYTELYFTEAFWPEFSLQDLMAALAWFQERQRRFGRRQ